MHVWESLTSLNGKNKYFSAECCYNPDKQKRAILAKHFVGRDVVHMVKSRYHSNQDKTLIVQLLNS